MQVTIDIPEDLARRLRNETDAPQRVRQALVIEAYLDGQLTRGQVGELLGLSFYETEDWFRQKGLRRDYHLDDLQADRQSLDRLLPEK